MLQQMGNDDETKPSGEAVEPEVPEEDAEVVAERLWGQVTALCLDALPSNLPAMEPCRLLLYWHTASVSFF
jgi:hypothetical protein